jgi:hypothetical protein
VETLRINFFSSPFHGEMIAKIRVNIYLYGMLKVLISTILCFCIFQGSYRSRIDVESYLNSMNPSGYLSAGDADFDGDGQVETRKHTCMKSLRLVKILFVKVAFTPLEVAMITFEKISFLVVLLIQQVDPDLFLRPPILN